MRADNLARKVEHEFLGHGILGLDDYDFGGLGAVENQLYLSPTNGLATSRSMT